MQSAILFSRRSALVAAATLVLPGRTFARQTLDRTRTMAFPAPSSRRSTPARSIRRSASSARSTTACARCGTAARFAIAAAATIAAPASFLRALPPAPLDGELWLGRGRFEPLAALVRRRDPQPAGWQAIRYMVFDLPIGGPSFAERLDRLAAIGASARAPIEIAPQWRVADRAELQRTLARVVAGGGEGLMLHRASAAHVAGRSTALFKLKPYLDAEAVVVGHRAGAGRVDGLVGALEVESAQGRRFLIGSGLDDAARREPPPIGATVTYRYRGLTSSGLPRFATYLRRHEDD